MTRRRGSVKRRVSGEGEAVGGGRRETEVQEGEQKKTAWKREEMKKNVDGKKWRGREGTI